jgi:iron complex outermembrane recepter protein
VIELNSGVRRAWQFSLGFAVFSFLGTSTAFADNDLAPEVVVVTATRSLNKASELPVSIDRLSAQSLTEGKLQVNLSEALGRVPGINVENRQNYAQDMQISSRGFGARASFGVRGIRLYSDGIPATMPDGQGQVAHFDLASAESLEVMRGPFSVLYGNAAGGVIAITTMDGGPDQTLEPSLQIGSFGTERAAVKASGETNSIAYVISGSKFRTDGFRRHSVSERETLNIKISGTPWADTRLTLVANDFASPHAQDPLGLTRLQMETDRKQAGSNAVLYNARKSVDQRQIGLALTSSVGAGDTLSLSGYTGERAVVQFQSIPFGAQSAATHPGGVIDFARDFEGYDLRWSRDFGADNGQRSTTKLSVGVSEDRLDETRRGYQNFVGTSLGVLGALRRDERNSVVGRDIYAQLEWHPLQNIRLFGGVRQSRQHINTTDYYIVGINGNDSGATKFSATTPAFGASYRARENLNVYFSAGRGFESPTLNELSYQPSGASGLNFALQPANSRHLEAGIKWRPYSKISVNAAVFRVATKNEIAISTNTGGRSSFRNVGRTQRSGLEIAGQAQFDYGVSVAVAYTQISARYLDSAASVSPATVIVIGNQMPGLPSNSTYAEVTWRPIGSGFVAALEAKRRGRILVNDGNTDATTPSFTTNLLIGLEQRSGAWVFKEFVRVDNLADKSYVGTVIVNESQGRYFEPAPGRNGLFGVSAKYVF